jgi:hypothetical protein
VVKEFKFEIEITFKVPTFAIEATRFVVRLAKLETDRTLRVPTFAIVAVRLVVRLAKLEIVRTLRVPMFAVGVTKEDAFEIPDTFRDVKVPTDVMLGWAA